MDTASRLLRLLVLLSSRPSWSAVELSERLEVTDRTLRRDVTRLRGLGYPVEATTGRYGGYALAAGGRLPPLLLDDDEAVAVTIGLRDISLTTDPTTSDAALSALTKLGQVLPAGLRQRIDTLGGVTVHDQRIPNRPDSTDVGVVMELAGACRRGAVQRFDYRRNDGQNARRHIEPHRLVNVSRRWYLMAFDLERDDWRPFRVDRIGPPVATGARCRERAVPDPLSFVTSGLAVRMFETSAVVRVHVPPAEARRLIRSTIGLIETTDERSPTTTVRIGGDFPWIARYLVGLEVEFEVLEPEELRAELCALGRRLSEAFGPRPAADGDAPASTPPARGRPR